MYEDQPQDQMEYCDIVFELSCHDLESCPCGDVREDIAHVFGTYDAPCRCLGLLLTRLSALPACVYAGTLVGCTGLNDPRIAS